MYKEAAIFFAGILMSGVPAYFSMYMKVHDIEGVLPKENDRLLEVPAKRSTIIRSSKSLRFDGKKEEAQTFDFDFKVKNAWIEAVDNIDQIEKLKIVNISGSKVTFKAKGTSDNAVFFARIWVTSY